MFHSVDLVQDWPH